VSLERFIGADRLHVRDDGRTVEGCIVPYGQVAEVVERDPDTGEVSRYPEQFLRHSCMKLAQVCSRRGNAAFISLVLDHDESRDAEIGYARSLTSEDDGAYATFRLYESRDLEKHVSMLRESHTGLSVKFADLRPPKLLDGVVSRVQVGIEHVAATPIPTYAGAGILSVRAMDGTELRDTPQLDGVRAFLASIKGEAS